MFDTFKNKFTKNNIYEDISTLYDIVDICDNYILAKKSNSLKQIHIYKIEPVTLLNSTKYVMDNILNTYIEFLRSMNIDYQIYMENTKVNMNDYFNHIVLTDQNANKEKLARIYKGELENFFNDNNIYIFNYYIVLTIDIKDNLDEITKDIYNLEKIGLCIIKLEGKENLNSFIYSKINKVDNIC